MNDAHQESPRRVLIASANPLFARGLQKLLLQRSESRGIDVRFAGDMLEITTVLETWHPNIVILDYDDAGAPGKPGNIQREAFLSQFIAGDRPMQVMLVSLRASGEVIVYDRRTLTPAQAEDWLEMLHANPDSTPDRAPLDQPPPSLPGASNSKIHPDPRSGGMKHYVIAGILTVILTLVIGFAMSAIGLMPLDASTQAVPIDQMINLQVWMIAFLFSLITVFIVYSVFVFRRRRPRTALGEISPVSTAPGAHMKGSNSLEIAWTVVPLVTVIFLSFLGARDLGQIRKADSTVLDVKVTAFQWGWSYQYAESGVISNTLVLPVNRQVRLLLTSRDVIHSFWVPEFRVKQDILPGENLVKELRITPNRIGYYKVRCAEMCGLNHAGMEGLVMVTSQAGFEDWIADMAQNAQANAGPAGWGQTLAQNTGCIGCHSIDGKPLVGPTWKGLAGSQVTLSDGSTVTVDDAYLREAIIDPNTKVRQGAAPGVMPQNYKDQLTDEQLTDIIEYIKTLK
jgi:cytochrome c oxidase subunit 2